MKKPKIVFFGTPEYVVPILSRLHKAFVSGAGISPISAVVTQKPAPAGREQKITYSAVDKWAHTHKVQILYRPEDILKENIDADLGVCASFGEIIPKSVIDYFKFGILNIHPSLLPKYRGASPVQATILSGENQTGVSIIKMDEKVDHGPIVSQFKNEINPNDTTETLRARLFEKSAEVLAQLIESYLQGKIKSREQNHKEATFTTRVTRDDGFIPPEYLETALQGLPLRNKKWQIPFIKDFSLSPNPYLLYAFIRAMQPWPGAWTQIKSQRDKVTKLLRLKILKAHLQENELVLDEVQLEGKNPVSWKQFTEAYPEAKFS